MPKFVDPNEEIEFLESEIIEDDDDEDIPVGELVIHQPANEQSAQNEQEKPVQEIIETSTDEPADNDFIVYEEPTETLPVVDEKGSEKVDALQPAEKIAEEKDEIVESNKDEKNEYNPSSLNESDIWGLAKIDVKKPVIKKEKPVENKAEIKEESQKDKAVEKKDDKPEKVKKTAEQKDDKQTKTDNGEKKVVGKFVIEQNEDIYLFCLYANNGQLLYESREYASLATCKGGIETFKKNVAVCDYRIAQDKNGNWKYIFRKGNSIYIGESYKTEQSATNSAESTKRFAAISEIAD